MATATGFSIKSLVSTIRQQDPNIDVKDAKEIAEQIRNNIMKSLVGERVTYTRRTPAKSKEEAPKKENKKEDKKETYRTPDGKFSSFNKMVEGGLKEIRNDLKKNTSGISTIEKNSNEIGKDIKEIIKNINSERVSKSKDVQQEKYKLINPRVTVEKDNQEMTGERMSPSGVLSQIKKIQEENSNKLVDLAKDVKFIKNKSEEQDNQTKEAKEAEKKYALEDLNKKLDSILEKLSKDKKESIFDIFSNLLGSTFKSALGIITGILTLNFGTIMRALADIGSSLVQAGAKGLRWLGALAVENPVGALVVGTAAVAVGGAAYQANKSGDLEQQILKASALGDKKKVEELVRQKKRTDIMFDPGAEYGVGETDAVEVEADIEKQTKEYLGRGEDLRKNINKNWEMLKNELDAWIDSQQDVTSEYREKLRTWYMYYYDVWKKEFPTDPPDINSFISWAKQRAQSRYQADHKKAVDSRAPATPSVEPPKTDVDGPGSKNKSAERIATTPSGSGGTTTIGNETRTGGTVSWRNNNPGNIVYGDFAIKQGAVGYVIGDGGVKLAVFPDMETGRKAHKELLTGGEYNNLSVGDALRKWSTGSTTSGASAGYVGGIINELGVDSSKRISDLSPKELDSLLKIQQKWEGFKEGTVSDTSFSKDLQKRKETAPPPIDVRPKSLTDEQRKQVYKGINENPAALAEEQEMERNKNYDFSKQGDRLEYDRALYDIAEKYNVNFAGKMAAAVTAAAAQGAKAGASQGAKAGASNKPQSPALPEPFAYQKDYSYLATVMGQTDLVHNKLSLLDQ